MALQVVKKKKVRAHSQICPRTVKCDFDFSY